MDQRRDRVSRQDFVPANCQAEGKPEAHRVLVVNDDPLIREMLGRTLSAAGYDVLCVADGKQAIQTFSRTVVDLVITGISMPEASGLVVIDTLRPLYPKLKFIVIGDADEPRAHLNAAKAFGATEILVKPFETHQLKDCVADVLAEK